MFSSRKTGSASNAYNLTNSLRFRSSASAYLNRTFGTPTDNKKFTWSGWVKRGTLGAFQVLQCGDDGTSDNFLSLRFSDTDTLQCFQIGGGSYNLQVSTSAVFRDPSAWYHIVFVYDSANATSTNRIQFYVNGVLQAVSYAVGPFAQNTASQLNVASRPNAIGRLLYASVQYFDGYLDEVNFIDGQALTPSSFGATSVATGVWQPIKYTGTYGTNGFYLPFTNTASTSTLGNDFSGNGNTWTVNNISLTAGSTYDSMTDVPTLTSATVANYCVLNPLNINLSAGSIGLSDGNLTKANNGNGAIGTILSSSDKYYCEIVYTAISGTVELGVCDNEINLAVGYKSDGTKDVDSFSTNSAYGSSYTTNDVIGIALDATSKTVTFYKNNVSQGAVSYTRTGNLTFFATGRGAATYAFVANFGQRPFAYTPPSGFVRLNTFNLPTPTIGATASTTANKYFDATIWTGNGSTSPISFVNAAGFQPDLVWAKARSAAYSPNLYDSVRGVGKELLSDSTAAEVSNNPSGYVSAFNTNGFSSSSSGINYYFNQSGVTYVGWQWRASNTTAVTNTAGSITSTVSASTTAGFSVVTYTGNGTIGATIGHGLGVAPSMLIVKQRAGGAESWQVYHSTLGATQYLQLNTTGAAASNINRWNNTAPTSTVFTVYNDTINNGNTNTYVAYCFAQVAGYSAFGSYTGNGSSDGPFVFTGFRPRFVMFKRTDSTANWWMIDTSRSSFNQMADVLLADSSGAEFTSGTGWPGIDYLSNGFKLRGTASGINASGGTYIYMAFAESPFKYANAR